MGRKYNIIKRLKEKNEKPFVTLDEEHSYEINTSKSTVMGIMVLYDDQKDEQSNVSNIELIDTVIKMALGEKALEYINSQDFTMDATSDIVKTIMAGISNVELEEIDKEEKNSKKS